jgi:hypothetical protein
VIGANRQIVGRLENRHPRDLGEQLGQMVFARGVQMLDQDEGHAGLRRQPGEQLRKGFKPAGRRSDPDNRKRSQATTFRHVRRRRFPYRLFA